MAIIKNKELVNIPTNSLTVVEQFTEVSSCKVRLFRKGIISLTGFAITQFMEGAELMVANSTIKMIDTRDVQLILKLSKSIPMLQAEPVINIDVDYRDLKTLRSWLELRIQHCEQERDARTTLPWDENKQKFNPDTYVGQKLLLLDLRELMLGEIIDLQKY